jgi:hypothetical protein
MAKLPKLPKPPKGRVMSSDDTRRISHYIELLEAELRESMERQRSLIAALDRAKAELHALDGGALYFDGERLDRG